MSKGIIQSDRQGSAGETGGGGTVGASHVLDHRVHVSLVQVDELVVPELRYEDRRHEMLIALLGGRFAVGGVDACHPVVEVPADGEITTGKGMPGVSLGQHFAFKALGVGTGAGVLAYASRVAGRGALAGCDLRAPFVLMTEDGHVVLLFRL